MEQASEADNFERPLTENQAAKELKMSRRQTSKAMDVGDLRYVVFAGRRWVPRSAVKQYQEAFK